MDCQVLWNKGGFTLVIIGCARQGVPEQSFYRNGYSDGPPTFSWKALTA